MSFLVRRMDDSLRADFRRLHSDDNGLGWCHCVAWWVDTWDGWGDRTAEQNRALRDELFEAGEYDGYLLFEGDEPIAWCQVGPRDRLAKLVRQFEREPDPQAWAITCFAVASGARRRGAARALLGGVLEDLEERSRLESIGRVEAYPRVTGDGEPGALELWNGPERLYREAGFEPQGRVGERWIMERALGGAGRGQGV